MPLQSKLIYVNGYYTLSLWTGLWIAYPHFIPMHIGYTACTIREQFGYKYAESACKERSELYGDFGACLT